VNELPEELARALRSLEGRAARRAEAVSAERVTVRVLARLRAEPAGDAGGITGAWWARRRWVGLAAAALLVVFAGTVAVRHLGTRAVGPVSVPVLARGLDSLDATGLESVLRVTDEVRPQVTGVVEVAGSGNWDDLSEEQLRAVLQAVQQSAEGTL
jgi:hypothetical protein